MPDIGSLGARHWQQAQGHGVCTGYHVELTGMPSIRLTGDSDAAQEVSRVGISADTLLKRLACGFHRQCNVCQQVAAGLGGADQTPARSGHDRRITGAKVSTIFQQPSRRRVHSTTRCRWMAGISPCSSFRRAGEH